MTMTDLAGTLEKALERHPLNVKHDRPLPLLDLTLGEVPGYPSDVNKSPHSKASEVFPTGLAQ